MKKVPTNHHQIIVILETPPLFRISHCLSNHESDSLYPILFNKNSIFSRTLVAKKRTEIDFP